MIIESKGTVSADFFLELVEFSKKYWQSWTLVEPFIFALRSVKVAVNYPKGTATVVSPLPLKRLREKELEKALILLSHGPSGDAINREKKKLLTSLIPELSQYRKIVRVNHLPKEDDLPSFAKKVKVHLRGITYKGVSFGSLLLLKWTELEPFGGSRASKVQACEAKKFV